MGKAARVVIIMAIVALVVLGVVFVMPRGGAEGDVIVLCGGSMRAVLKDCIERYKQTSKDNIMGTYGGSGELCAQLQNAGKGDLYLCHDPFMPWAADKGLIDKWKPVGYLEVVIIVPKGNPKGIKDVKDLAQEGLRLGVGNQVYSTSGVLVKEMLNKLPEGEAIRKNVRVETKGHQQRCNDVAMGTLDAGIVWAAVAGLFKDKLDIIPIPKEHVHAVTSATYGKSDLKNVGVTLGLTKAGAQNPAAVRFYDYVTTQCEDLFQKHGFRLTKE